MCVAARRNNTKMSPLMSLHVRHASPTGLGTRNASKVHLSSGLCFALTSRSWVLVLLMPRCTLHFEKYKYIEICGRLSK